MYKVIKRYGHDQGWSCCFRQWRTPTHCRLLHGYPFSFELTFQAETLDDRNWVIGFGDLKEIKAWMQDMFDHTLIVAADDPQLADLQQLEAKGLAKIKLLPHVGCEFVAKYVFDYINSWCNAKNAPNGVRLKSVMLSEHQGNSAVWEV